MHSDEERLYDPNDAAGDNDNDNINIDDDLFAAPAGALEVRFPLERHISDETASVSDASSSSLTTEPPAPAPTERRILILEPASFAIFMATFLSSAVYQNQILYQTCVAVFHYKSDECEPLLGKGAMTPYAQQIEAEVQPYAARIIMTKSVIDSLMPAFISLFIGPWSDKYGRRPILLTTVTGGLISYTILSVIALIALYVTVSPWLFLLSSFPALLSGGMCAYITATYSYISDVATDKTKAIRMITNDALGLGLGLVAGNVCGGYTVKPV